MRLCLALLFLPCAAAAAVLEATASPDHLVLGKDASAQVRVRADDCIRLTARASAGTLTMAGAVGKECRFTWAAPPSKLPATALLAFWEADAGAPEPVLLKIPLYGRTELEAQTEPGATVSVEVGALRFGPEQADRRGRVRVGIDVPPGITTASVVAEASGRITRRDAALGLPVPNPLVAFVLEGPTPGGPGWVIVASAASLPAGDLDLAAPGATFGLISSHPSLAVYRLAPNVSAAVELKVGLRGVPGAHAEVVVAASLGPAPAEAEPPPLLPTPPRDWSLFVGLGAIYAGPSAFGAAASLGGAVRLPVRRFSLGAELAVGVGSVGVVTVPAAGNELDSSVTLFPIELGLRARVLDRAPWSLDLKVGGGVLPYALVARSLLSGGFSDAGAIPEGLLSVQGSYQLEGWMVFLELRGQLTSGLSARVPNALSGAWLALGLRYGTL